MKYPKGIVVKWMPLQVVVLLVAAGKALFDGAPAFLVVFLLLIASALTAIFISAARDEGRAASQPEVRD